MNSSSAPSRLRWLPSSSPSSSSSSSSSSSCCRQPTRAPSLTSALRHVRPFTFQTPALPSKPWLNGLLSHGQHCYCCLPALAPPRPALAPWRWRVGSSLAGPAAPACPAIETRRTCFGRPWRSSGCAGSPASAARISCTDKGPTENTRGRERHMHTYKGGSAGQLVFWPWLDSSTHRVMSCALAISSAAFPPPPVLCVCPRPPCPRLYEELDP